MKKRYRLARDVRYRLFLKNALFLKNINLFDLPSGKPAFDPFPQIIKSLLLFRGETVSLEDKSGTTPIMLRLGDNLSFSFKSTEIVLRVAEAVR